MKFEIRLKNSDKEPISNCSKTKIKNSFFDGILYTLEITKLEQLIKLSKNSDLIIKNKGDFNIPLIILEND